MIGELLQVASIRIIGALSCHASREDHMTGFSRWPRKLARRVSITAVAIFGAPHRFSLSPSSCVCTRLSYQIFPLSHYSIQHTNSFELWLSERDIRAQPDLSPTCRKNAPKTYSWSCFGARLCTGRGGCLGLFLFVLLLRDACSHCRFMPWHGWMT